MSKNEPSKTSAQVSAIFAAGLLMAAIAFSQDNDNGGIFAVAFTLVVCAVVLVTQKRRHHHG